MIFALNNWMSKKLPLKRAAGLTICLLLFARCRTRAPNWRQVKMKREVYHLPHCTEAVACCFVYSYQYTSLHPAVKYTRKKFSFCAAFVSFILSRGYKSAPVCRAHSRIDNLSLAPRRSWKPDSFSIYFLRVGCLTSQLTAHCCFSNASVRAPHSLAKTRNKKTSRPTANRASFRSANLNTIFIALTRLETVLFRASARNDEAILCLFLNLF